MFGTLETGTQSRFSIFAKLNLIFIFLGGNSIHENLFITLMGLIFARTNFRELENFAFREYLFSRMSCFTFFYEDLFSRIGYAENFREY